MLMNARELFRAIMCYESFDRMPVIHWNCWWETRQRWIAEGMPTDADPRAFFNAAPHWRWVWGNSGLYPKFVEETLEESEDWRIFRDEDGVLQKAWKHQSGIPHYIGFTLREAKDWPLYQARLQPNTARLPADLDAQLAEAEASGLPLAIGTGSLMGWVRGTGWASREWPI